MARQTAVDKELAEAWVSALESGKYKQTDGHLKDDEGYCCLGVLLEVAMERGLIGGHWEAIEAKDAPLGVVVVYNFVVDDVVGLNGASGYYVGTKENQQIPLPLAYRLGLDDGLGDLPNHDWRIADDIFDTLAEANDSGNADFKAIAAGIRLEVIENGMNEWSDSDYDEDDRSDRDEDLETDEDEDSDSDDDE